MSLDLLTDISIIPIDDEEWYPWEYINVTSNGTIYVQKAQRAIIIKSNKSRAELKGYENRFVSKQGEYMTNISAYHIIDNETGYKGKNIILTNLIREKLSFQNDIT